MASSDYPTALHITLAVRAGTHSEIQDRGHHRQCHSSCCRGQAVPVAYFSTTTHLTKDSSDFRSTRAAALIFTLKDCLGPLLSSMSVCRGAIDDDAARGRLQGGTGWTPFGQVAGQFVSQQFVRRLHSGQHHMSKSVVQLGCPTGHKQHPQSGLAEV